jgi:BirA family biotin operon repressor/biotin-[acetyl-CoA-carboxylase] ligase
LNLVKLHASASTNEDLRVRFRESELPNLTTIFTHTQTQGKGQRGTRWESEPYKNLTFSILITDLRNFDNLFSLNKLVSVALVTWLQEQLRVTAKIKWPNDILSVNHKLAGVLVETIFKGSQKNHAIIGIGLNVNQTDFIHAPRAISLKQITGNVQDLDKLLLSFLNHFKQLYHNPTALDAMYMKHFYKLDKLVSYTINGHKVQATVRGVDDDGKLLLEYDGVLSSYELKEVAWNY